jgi:hypothetical protein
MTDPNPNLDPCCSECRCRGLLLTEYRWVMLPWRLLLGLLASVAAGRSEVFMMAP